jgi:hypothetical protein
MVGDIDVEPADLPELLGWWFAAFEQSDAACVIFRWCRGVFVVCAPMRVSNARTACEQRARASTRSAELLQEGTAARGIRVIVMAVGWEGVRHYFCPFRSFSK